MAQAIDLAECLGCGACESACPQAAITQSSGFPVIYVVDPLLCNDCDRCVTLCPVDGFERDVEWAVCHGRGCPLSSKRYSDVECSEGREACPTCGSPLWRLPDGGGAWTCRTCVEGRVASCPKAKRAVRIPALSS